MREALPSLMHTQVICPRREVRDFRMLRFKDAQNSRKAAMRVGMLSVWDAKALEGGLQEGHRYLVWVHT